MNSKIVHFKQSYLSEVVTLWNESLRVDLINEDRFIHEILLDENYQEDLALVLLVDNVVSGFVLGMKRVFPYLERGLEPHRAWVNVIFIKEELRNQGYGTRLLEHVEAQLVKQNASEITLAAYSPNYFFPGVDIRSYSDALHFFTKNKYHGEETAVSMKRELWNYKFPDYTTKVMKKASAEGYKFKKFDKSYTLELLSFLKENFGGGWKRNAMQAMQNGHAEEVIWLCISPENTIVGFCMRKIDGCDHRFGPFGVHETLRSKGLGGVLFELMQQDMKSRKIYQSYFLWTDGPGQRFYERHEYEVYRTYKLMKKEIEL